MATAPRTTARRDTTTKTMVTGDDDNDVDGDGAKSNKVDNDGDGATGNEVDDDGDGATGDENDDDGDGDGDGTMGSD